MLLYCAFVIGTTLARVVPLRVSYGIARLVGIGAYYAWSGGRRRCIQNMLHITEGDERAARRFARASFANYLAYLVDFFRLMGTSQDELRGRVRSDDWDRVRAEHMNEGIVVMTMHYGNWDLGAALMALSGVTVVAIADRFANARVNDFVIGSREHLGMRIIPADRMGPGLIRALCHHEVVAVLLDIPAPENGVRVTFFGDTIAVSDGPARLALRTGAAVVMGIVPRVTRWDEEVHAYAANVPFEPTGDEVADVRAITQAIFTQFEQHVRRDPAQWYIFRNIWLSDMPRDLAVASTA